MRRMITKMFVLGGLIWFAIPVSTGDPHRHKAMLSSVVSAGMHAPAVVRFKTRPAELFPLLATTNRLLAETNAARPHAVANIAAGLRDASATAKRSRIAFKRIGHDIDDAVLRVRQFVAMHQSQPDFLASSHIISDTVDNASREINLGVHSITR